MGNQPLETRRKYGDFYDSGERIGSGTFATVKRCVRKTDKKEFAVKIIDKRHLTGRELVGLQDEIRILRTMEHPNIIKMADVFDDGRRVKLVLELCHNGDLFDQILKSPKRRFDETRAAKITAITARSLKYLHQHYVVHRDLKPENILFTKEGILKITDFGLAHYLKLPPELHLMHTCCGTPHYVAPEVLSTNEYGPQIDLWSLGVVLYIMLSGYQPFNSHSIHAMYGLIIRGQYKFPSPHWDDISEDAKDCVRGLMNVDPSKRLTPDTLMDHKWIRDKVNLKQLELEEAQQYNYVKKKFLVGNENQQQSSQQQSQQQEQNDQQKDNTANQNVKTNSKSSAKQPN